MSELSKKDVTSLVQRLEAFEQRLGVRIEALSAFESGDYSDDEVRITVRGELHSESGTGLDQDIELEVAVYDGEGRVVETASQTFMADSFFGFATFQLSAYVTTGLAKKLRLIPKAY